MEEFTMIHALKAQGYSIRAIARETGLDRRTISKRLKEEELKSYKNRKFQSKLDSYKEYIKKRVEEALPDKIPSSVIYEEISDMGYNGKVRILQSHMSKLYNELLGSVKKDIIRFETEPGLQAQCDWTVIRGGKSPLYGFVIILGNSRYTYVQITENMKQETFQQCHKNAFEYFGGIPKTILYDNLKSVIIKRDKYGKSQHGFNDKFLDFAKSYKFVPKVCKPYRPETKGKVERFNLYLKNNFYKPLKAKLKGSGIEIDKELLNNYLSPWLIKANNRIHSTTKKQPSKLLKEEQKYLTPLGSIISIKSEKVENNSIKSNKQIEYSKVSNNMLNYDISYFTKLDDYEQLLQGTNHA